MNNITLIGMPGAGKSTIGVVLAKVLGYQFLDSDLLIQKQEKRRLSEIIEEEGYKGFKDVENRVNAFKIEPKDGTIYLKGVVSRKKQLIPPLMEAAQMIGSDYV